MNDISGWLEKISKHEAWEIARPWLTTSAMRYGDELLPDNVPGYFREKLNLKGINTSNEKFRDRLTGPEVDLLEKNKDLLGEKRIHLYQQLESLEAAGEHDSAEYRELESRLESTQPTRVRVAIENVKKKLASLDESTRSDGSTSATTSDARKEMSSILQELNKAARNNKENLRKDVNTILSDYTSEKVDGVIAAREVLRTAQQKKSTNGGAVALDTILDGASFVNNISQNAQRDGKSLDTDSVHLRVVETVESKWQDLKEEKNPAELEGEKLDAQTVASKLVEEAKKYNIDTSNLNLVNQLAIPLASVPEATFQKIKPAENIDAPTEDPDLDADTINTEEPTPQDTSRPKTSPAVDTQPPSVPKTQHTTNDNTAAAAPPKRQSFSDTTRVLPRKGDTRDTNFKNDNRVPSTPKPTSVASDQSRRQGADRSALGKSAYAFDNPKSSGKTTDQYFSEQYGQRASIQPMRGGIVEKKPEIDLTNPQQRRGGQQTIQAVPQARSRVSNVKTEKKSGGRSPIGEAPSQRNRKSYKAKAARMALRSTGVGAVVGAVASDEMIGKAIDKMKLRAVNMSIWSWASLTASLQLILGLVALGFLGLAYAYGEVKDFFKADSDNKFFNFILRGVEVAASSVGKFIGTIGKALGISFGIANPMDIYVSLHALLFAFGMMALLVAGMEYKFAGFKPLFGDEGVAVKPLVFVLCLIGYSLPVLHMLPWVLAWALVVSKYPK